MDDQHRVTTHIETYSPLRHAAGLVRLYEQGFVDSAAANDAAGSTNSRGLLQDLSTANGLVCVADGIGVVAGLTSYTHPNRRDTRIIANVVTDLRFRRQGLARAMVCMALRQAQAGSVQQVALQVDAANDAAIQLYESCGFYRVGEVAYWRRDVASLPFHSECELRRADRADEAGWAELLRINHPPTLSYAEPHSVKPISCWWIGEYEGLHIGAICVDISAHLQMELLLSPGASLIQGHAFVAHALNRFWTPATTSIELRQSAHALMNLRVLRSCGFIERRRLLHMLYAPP